MTTAVANSFTQNNNNSYIARLASVVAARSVYGGSSSEQALQAANDAIAHSISLSNTINAEISNVLLETIVSNVVIESIANDMSSASARIAALAVSFVSNELNTFSADALQRAGRAAAVAYENGYSIEASRAAALAAAVAYQNGKSTEAIQQAGVTASNVVSAGGSQSDALSVADTQSNQVEAIRTQMESLLPSSSTLVLNIAKSQAALSFSETSDTSVATSVELPY